jgi:Tol biopolymer transport system component
MLAQRMPAGDQVLIESNRTRGLRDLRLVDTSRALTVNLTRTPNSSEENAEWSPDGAVVAYIYGEVMIRDVCVRVLPRVDGRCAASTGSWDDRPRWSPDASTIMFQSVTFSGSVRLSLLPGDLSSRIDLLAVGGYLDYAWSADSRYIVFTAGLNYPLLHVMDILGTGQPQRLFTDSYREYSPGFSPDGRWLAFISESASGQDIYRIPTSCLRQVETCAQLRERLTMRDSSFAAFDWSPDSRALIYTSRHGRGYQLTLLDLDALQERFLTDDNRQYASPRFSPSGDSIVYLSGGGARFDLYLLTLDEGAEPLRLTADGWDNWSPRWRPRQRAGLGCPPSC